MHYTYGTLATHIKGPLGQIAPYAQHVKELRLWLNVSQWRVAELLVSYFPNIVRVYLKVDEFNYSDHGERPRSQVGVHLSLKEFDIGFQVTKGRPFPREDCRKTLTRLTEVCPALEVVRFGALFPVDGGDIDERDIPLDLLMDMRRTAGGEWQERKWGVVTPI